MNPVHRLAWLSALAHLDLPAGAFRVAAMCAEASRDGRFMHSTGTIAKQLGMAPNTASRALDSLTEAGFLVLEKHSSQHKPAIYRLSRVPTAGESEDGSRPPKAGVPDNIQTPHAEVPDPPKKAPRPPTAGDHREGREKHGGKSNAADDNGRDEFLSQVRRLKGSLTRHGESIEDEWQQLAAEHGEATVIDSLKRCKFPRWPSAVRKDLAATEAGLVFDAPLPTPDEARAAMGLPVGTPDHG